VTWYVWHAHPHNTFLRAWGPNIGTGFAVIAFTISVVERIVRAEADAARRPRTEHAKKMLSLHLGYFLLILATDYLFRFDDDRFGAGGDGIELIDAWLTLFPGTKSYDKGDEQLVYWLQELRDELISLRAEDLPPRVVPEIDDFCFRAANALRPGQVEPPSEDARRMILHNNLKFLVGSVRALLTAIATESAERLTFSGVVSSGG
jgi:hypothetical protein